MTRDPAVDPADAPSVAETAVPPFAVEVLGEVTVVAQPGGRRLMLPKGCREVLGALALFAVLRPIRREALAELLWPEADADASRARLRTGLWRLRRSLAAAGGPAAAALLCQNADLIWLNRAALALPAHLEFAIGVERLCGKPVAVMDVAGFREMDALLAIYTGPLMEGHDSAWVLAERARLADLYGRALERQIIWYRSRDDGDNAANLARRLLSHDPYREDIHELLIGHYAGAGQPRRALQQFQECRAAFEGDLGLPAARAKAALERALAPDAAGLTQVIAGLDASIRRLDRQISLFCAAMDKRSAPQPVRTRQEAEQRAGAR